MTKTSPVDEKVETFDGVLSIKISPHKVCNVGIMYNAVFSGVGADIEMSGNSMLLVKTKNMAYEKIILASEIKNFFKERDGNQEIIDELFNVERSRYEQIQNNFTWQKTHK